MATMETCHLYLVRHAIAAERGPEWPDDTKRPLTHRGVARMRMVATGMRSIGVRVDVVCTSPLVRARQTAKLLVECLRPKPESVVVPALAPGHSPASVVKALQRAPVASSLMLVGHEPDLGRLAAWFIGAREPLSFKKGGVCRIDVASAARPRDGVLVWMATPKMLRALAGD